MQRQDLIGWTTTNSRDKQTISHNSIALAIDHSQIAVAADVRAGNWLNAMHSLDCESTSIFFLNF